MAKKAISVTLDQNNLLWLRGRSIASRHRSLSETIDRLITEARTAGAARGNEIRSVVGTITLPDDDPDLEKADAYVRKIFEDSVKRTMRQLRETPRRGKK